MARTRGAKNKAKKPMMSFNERVRKVIKGEAETKEKVVNIFNQSLVNSEYIFIFIIWINTIY